MQEEGVRWKKRNEGEQGRETRCSEQRETVSGSKGGMNRERPSREEEPGGMSGGKRTGVRGRCGGQR